MRRLEGHLQLRDLRQRVHDVHRQRAACLRRRDVLVRVQRRLRALRRRVHPVHDCRQLRRLRQCLLGEHSGVRPSGRRRGGCERVHVPVGLSGRHAHAMQRQLRRPREQRESLRDVYDRLLNEHHERRGQLRRTGMHVRVQYGIYPVQWVVRGYDDQLGKLRQLRPCVLHERRRRRCHVRRQLVRLRLHERLLSLQRRVRQRKDGQQQLRRLRLAVRLRAWTYVPGRRLHLQCGHVSWVRRAPGAVLYVSRPVRMRLSGGDLHVTHAGRSGSPPEDPQLLRGARRRGRDWFDLHDLGGELRVVTPNAPQRFRILAGEVVGFAVVAIEIVQAICI